MSAADTAQQSRSTPKHDDRDGLVQPPFTLAPDPRFLYRGESHDAALTLLRQAIRRKEGFIVLTGELGTGKTTICRALVEGLEVTTIASLILNPCVSIEQLLREVLVDFGIVSREAARSGRLADATTHDLVATLHEFLLSLVTIRSSGVLIIDEAQHLSPQVLEQLRIIANPETSDTKLLQVVLAGEPALLDVLSSAELRQLDERIATRAVLKPLTRDEVRGYLAHRLEVAGSQGSVEFEPEAVDAVHRYTDGIPRRINQLCERALAAGASAGVGRMTPALVEAAAENLGLTRPAVTPEPVPRRSWPIAAAAVLLAAVLAAGVLLYLRPLDSWLEVDSPLAPSRPRLARSLPAQSRPIPTEDFLLPPPLPAPLRPADSSREVPDDQVGLRRPPG